MIRANNIMDAWRNALRRIKEKGFVFNDDEGRFCHEVENLVLIVEDVSNIEQPLHWIRAQSDWHYPTNDELERALFEASEEQSRYAYGARIFSYHNKLNQLDGHVIPLLKEHPQSRRAIVALSDPMIDEVNMRNVVSLLSVWFRVIEGKLHVTGVLRSSDFLLGWPANMYHLALLQKYVSERLKIERGSITTISLSAHYFEEDGWLLDRLEK